MNFRANGKEYILENLREKLKPNWREMLNPVKSRRLVPIPYAQSECLSKAEERLSKLGESLVGKDILEIGCGYGNHAYLMAKYEGTKVHGIDVDEYTVNQSVDLNMWNPKDLELAHNNVVNIRKECSALFPDKVSKKVTFDTCRIEDYATPNPHDVIFSFDVLEHLLDLRLAFNQMANSLKKGGIAYHEFNPFFSLTGGHTLCMLDFHYGHCLLSEEDFKRYIQEFRPDEEKIALNFYKKCLNRATLFDIKNYAKEFGFEILHLDGVNFFQAPERAVRKELETTILPYVKYPNVTVDDLLWDFTYLIMRKL